MGRELHYRPGSYYVTDDRTGFPTRAERTRKEWNGLRVSECVWEPRQPQDLVRGVKDDQTVPDPRVLAPASFVGPFWTTTTQAIAIRQYTVPLTDITGFAIGDLVAIMMDSGEMFRAYVRLVGDLGGGQVGLTLWTNLPHVVSAGAQVWDYGPIAGGPQQVLGTEDGFALTTENYQDILIT